MYYVKNELFFKFFRHFFDFFTTIVRIFSKKDLTREGIYSIISVLFSNVDEIIAKEDIICLKI